MNKKAIVLVIVAAGLYFYSIRRAAALTYNPQSNAYIPQSASLGPVVNWVKETLYGPEPVDGSDLIGKQWYEQMNPEPAAPLDNWDLLGDKSFYSWFQTPAQTAPPTQPAAIEGEFVKMGNDYNPQKNLDAFLATIRNGEGTGDFDGYRRMYGGALVTDLSDHPANLGWKGEKLPDAYCRAVGLSPGCVSTAAGAYQAIKPTWNAFTRAVGKRDFSPAAQNEFAAWLLKQVGAFTDAQKGNFARALHKASTQWASLPGSTAGQPTISFERALQVYAQNGGIALDVV